MKTSVVQLALVAVALGIASDVASAARMVSDPIEAPSSFALGASLLKTCLSLGAVIVLFAVGLRLFARWNRALSRAHPASLIEVLDSRRLEPKRALHVVRVEGQRWLVASCEAGISLTALAAVEAGQSSPHEHEHEQAPRAARFAELLLRRASGGRA